MEHVIWGIPPGETDENILYTKATTRQDAERVKAILTSKHGRTAVRIQELDGVNPLQMFRKSVRV